MGKFRQVSESFWASPQITLEDVALARAEGFALIVNNRPEGEAPDQTPGPDIEAATRAAGMTYRAIPIVPGGFSEDQVRTMAQTLETADGPVLAYCRSGTRSTLLWSLSRALQGAAPDTLVEAAGDAGYDLGPIRHLLDTLAAHARD